MRLFTINHRKPIIQEDDSNSTLSMFKAGLDRLITSLNPSTPNDLDILLKFVAPQGGGIQQIQQLLEIGDTSNKTWWNTLFKTFGLTDTTQQQEIINRTRDKSQAIKTCIGAATQNLNNKLTKIGLTPQSITADLQQWEQIQTRFKGNVKPSQVLEPNELQAYRDLAKRLIKAYKLVQPDINSSPYEDIEIEPPPSKPTPEDLSQMPNDDPLGI